VLVFGDQLSVTLPSAPERVMLNAVDEAANTSADVKWAAP